MNVKCLASMPGDWDCALIFGVMVLQSYSECRRLPLLSLKMLWWQWRRLFAGGTCRLHHVVGDCVLPLILVSARQTEGNSSKNPMIHSPMATFLFQPSHTVVILVSQMNGGSSPSWICLSMHLLTFLTRSFH